VLVVLVVLEVLVLLVLLVANSPDIRMILYNLTRVWEVKR
jgi:hypothetical protein